MLLLKAARRLEPFDPDLARETYLDAWEAAMFAGHLAVGGDLLEVSRAARAMSAPPRPPRPAGLLLDGLALLVTNGPAAAVPILRQASTAFASADIPAEKIFRWGWMARVADEAFVGRRRLASNQEAYPARPRRRRARPASVPAGRTGPGRRVER